MTTEEEPRLETPIKQDIKAYLDSLGADCWHVAFHNMGYGPSGIPDRLCCYKGRFLAIEVKRTPTAKPRKLTTQEQRAQVHQQRQIAAVIAAGGRAIVAWSVDHVREEIEAIDREFAR